MLSRTAQIPCSNYWRPPLILPAAPPAAPIAAPLTAPCCRAVISVHPIRWQRTRHRMPVPDVCKSGCMDTAAHGPPQPRLCQSHRRSCAPPCREDGENHSPVQQPLPSSSIGFTLSPASRRDSLSGSGSQPACLAARGKCKAIGSRSKKWEFKVVKIEGEFVWHKHADTDETFIVLDGVR